MGIIPPDSSSGGRRPGPSGIECLHCSPLFERKRPMRRSSILLSVAAVLIGLLAAVAPAGAITNGVPDGAAHPYVGIIFNDEAFCTGTLLSPTVFLTAGHCTVIFAE